MSLSNDGRIDDPEADYPTKFKLGDPVVDREQLEEIDDGERDEDDLGVALVVREGRVVAEEVSVMDTKTVADLNPDYPPSEPVVDVVFLGTLDHMMPKWRSEWERYTLDWRIHDYEKEYGVPITTYSYPASRLQRACDAGVDEHAALHGVRR